MKITIVIPYYNESDTILSTLDSVNNQTRKPERIILVDSGSTDNTTDKIVDWIEKKDLSNYLQIHSGEMSPSSSINMGIRKTNDDVIAYVDCGLSIPKDWLETSELLMISSKSDIVSSTIYTNGNGIAKF